MCLALAEAPGYIVGIATVVNALFNAYVVKTHPSFKSGELSRTGDPSLGLKSGREEVSAMIAAHPELEARATSAIVGGARALARASAAPAPASATSVRCVASAAVGVSGLAPPPPYPTLSHLLVFPPPSFKAASLVHVHRMLPLRLHPPCCPCVW
jgi:hypothetical protein